MIDPQKAGEAARIYATCLTSILIYDWLITLPKEVRLIWKPVYKNQANRSVWSLAATFCYVVVRYLCILEFSLFMYALWTVWSEEKCERFFRFEPYSTAFVVLAANCIMALRAWAIWDKDKRVGCLLTGLVVSMAAILMSTSYYVDAGKGVPYCLPVKSPKNEAVAAAWIAPLGFDLFIVCLTLFKAFQMHRNGTSLSPVLHILIRDGVFYFLGVFTCNLIATSFELQNAEPALKPIHATLANVGTAIFSARIMFNLKEAPYRQKVLIAPYDRQPENSWDTSGHGHGNGQGCAHGHAHGLSRDSKMSPFASGGRNVSASNVGLGIGTVGNMPFDNNTREDLIDPEADRDSASRNGIYELRTKRSLRPWSKLPFSRSSANTKPNAHAAATANLTSSPSAQSNFEPGSLSKEFSPSSISATSFTPILPAAACLRQPNVDVQSTSPSHAHPYSHAHSNAQAQSQSPTHSPSGFQPQPSSPSPGCTSSPEEEIVLSPTSADGLGLGSGLDHKEYGRAHGRFGYGASRDV